MLRREPRIWYPIVLSAYPVLYHFHKNMGKLEADELIVPTVVFLLINVAVWAIGRVLFSSWRIGALLCAVGVGLYLAYQPSFRYLNMNRIGEDPFARHSMVLWACAGVLVAMWIVVRLLRRKLEWTVPFLNVASAVLVASLGWSIYKKGEALPPPLNTSSLYREVEFPDVAPTTRPNIYYIILDGFGRADVLRDLYGFDQAPYLARLRELGFVIPTKATANYAQTLLSLSSSLNMIHLHGVARLIGERRNERGPLRELVEDNRLFRALKRLGYEIVSFSSGYSGTDMKGVDRELHPLGALSEFQNLLVNVSPLPHILRRLPGESLRNWQLDAHRRRVRFVFDSLESMSPGEKPRFVFAHVLSPHPPFVFDRDGAPLNPANGFSLNDASHFVKGGSPERYIAGYAGQAEYVSKRLVSIAEAVIKRDPAAIIVLQGDHGPGAHLVWGSYVRSNMRERMANFNAIRVPEIMKGRFPEEATPVNTFRIILSELFGATLDPLPNVPYFSRWHLPLAFRDVSRDVAGATNDSVGIEEDAHEEEERDEIE